MKSLKIVSTLLIAVGLVLTFTSCSKDKEAAVKTISKDQMVGKWNMSIQADGGVISVQAVLKASGSMELDQQPYDGIPDLILLWDMTGNNFTAHLDANGIINYWKLDAPVDPKTLTMAGQVKVNNNPNPPIIGTFTMDKQ